MENIYIDHYFCDYYDIRRIWILCLSTRKILKILWFLETMIQIRLNVNIVFRCIWIRKFHPWSETRWQWKWQRRGLTPDAVPKPCLWRSGFPELTSHWQDLQTLSLFIVVPYLLKKCRQCKATLPWYTPHGCRHRHRLPSWLQAASVGSEQAPLIHWLVKSLRLCFSFHALLPLRVHYIYSWWFPPQYATCLKCQLAYQIRWSRDFKPMPFFSDLGRAAGAYIYLSEKKTINGPKPRDPTPSPSVSYH